jgi:hypothetical protein
MAYGTAGANVLRVTDEDWSCPTSPPPMGGDRQSHQDRRAREVQRTPMQNVRRESVLTPDERNGPPGPGGVLPRRHPARTDRRALHTGRQR